MYEQVTEGSVSVDTPARMDRSEGERQAASGLETSPSRREAETKSVSNASVTMKQEIVEALIVG